MRIFPQAHLQLHVQRLPRTLSLRFRRWSSSLSPTERESITTWITSHHLPEKQPALLDYINPSQLKALQCTLPTLDGTIVSPSHRRVDFSKGSLLSPGHLLVFCNPATPERDLEPDATIRLLPPPAPFIRRMWAAGRFEFKNHLRIGENICAERAVSKIEAKRLDSDNPMIIVEQTIQTKRVGDSKYSRTGVMDNDCTTEVRSHVYVPLTNERRVRPIRDLPKSHFSFSYTPTETTLFRFSALTFNAHRIHLDREYSRQVEKLPERLVHGPMTALMLMEAVEHNRPDHLAISTFDYRATNQLFVNRPITIHGSWLEQNEVKLWAQSDDGVVGMVGEAYLKPSN